MRGVTIYGRPLRSWDCRHVCIRGLTYFNADSCESALSEGPEGSTRDDQPS
jgi:hypothetical protein